jgi:hypothetical protein
MDARGIGLNMSSPELLRREELIDQASLDALGLLDEAEAAHYARSFHAAPTSVQEEVRQIQAAIAADPQLLSDEEPPAGLRGRVLGAVQDAIEAEASQLQPIASIGVRRGDRAADERERGAAAVEMQRLALRVKSMQRTLTVWRAASVALAASLVAAVLWVTVIASEAMHVTQLAENKVSADTAQRFLGNAFPGFVRNAECELITLNGFGKDRQMCAVVSVNRTTGETFVMGLGLHINMDYTVRLVSPEGITDLGKITAGDPMTGAKLSSLDPRKLALGRLELLDRDGHTVLVSA